MAQAGSAQREPSMEEILASIRRIIEDSDTGRKPEAGIGQGSPGFEASSAAASDYEPADREAAPSRGEGAVIEVDAFRAELRAAAPTAVAPEPRKPVTLAEVQAQIAADARKRAGEDIEAVEPKAAPAVEPIGERVQAAEAPVEPDWRDPPAVQAEAPAMEAAPTPPPAAEVGAGDRERPEDAAAQPETDYEPSSAAELSPTRHAADSAAPAAAETGALRPAIISEHASRQVAAAFGELSDAFAARSKKTFDEMAEQMMRPMLQDWLDNNLPTLVERLVREEIERVARGA